MYLPFLRFVAITACLVGVIFAEAWGNLNTRRQYSVFICGCACNCDSHFYSPRTLSSYYSIHWFPGDVGCGQGCQSLHINMGCAGFTDGNGGCPSLRFTIIALFTLQAAWVASELAWSWIILLGAFIVDSSVTLIRWVMRGDKIYEAHRSHAYQYASRKYGSHVRVSLAFGGINLLWLLPLAFLAAAGWLDGLLTLLIAYLPLIWLAFHFKAGASELQEV